MAEPENVRRPPPRLGMIANIVGPHGDFTVRLFDRFFRLTPVRQTIMNIVVGPKRFLRGNNIESYIRHPAPGFRENVRLFLENDANTSFTLSKLIMNRTLGLSYLEIGKLMLEYNMSHAPITRILEHVPLMSLFVKARPVFTSDLAIFDEKKVLKISRQYTTPELFSNTPEVRLEIPKRTRAKILLQDFETVLLLAIHRLYNGSSGTFNKRGVSLMIDILVLSMYSDSPTDKDRVTNEAKKKLEELNIDHINNKELPFYNLFGPKTSRSLQHLACYVGIRDYLHHAVYLGNRLIIDAMAADLPGRLTYDSTMSIKHIDSLLEFAISKATTKACPAHIFIIPYTNPFPTRILRRRAFWTLGTFQYNPWELNCESFPSWIFENAHGAPSFCIPRPESEQVDITAFWSAITTGEHDENDENTSSASSSAAANLRRRQTGGDVYSADVYNEYDGDLDTLVQAYKNVNEMLQPLKDKRIIDKILEETTVPESDIVEEIQNMKRLFSIESASRETSSTSRKNRRRGSKRSRKYKRS